MRLSEDKIKAAILHPDIEIRDRAVRYFGKSFSPDLSIMPKDTYVLVVLCTFRRPLDRIST